MEIGNLVNQRPIGRVPNDMFLGRATSEVPQGPFSNTMNPSKPCTVRSNIGKLLLETLESRCSASTSTKESMAE